MKKMNFINKQRGITLISLVVTIIVIIILASISFSEGTKLIKEAKVESYVTNMITIKAKAKGYAEEVSSKTWGVNDDGTTRANIFSETYKMTKQATLSGELIASLSTDVVQGGYEAYLMTGAALEEIGLNSSDNNYIVVYNQSDFKKLEVLYKDGITYEGNTYYSLATLQEALEN